MVSSSLLVVTGWEWGSGVLAFLQYLITKNLLRERRLDLSVRGLV